MEPAWALGAMTSHLVCILGNLLRSSISAAFSDCERFQAAFQQQDRQPNHHSTAQTDLLNWHLVSPLTGWVWLGSRKSGADGYHQFCLRFLTRQIRQTAADEADPSIVQCCSEQ
ncbi:uncharacterized protein IWZ02DRAFT_162248 [Phyllosticta citriasiana]|uniref:uncharacterized protein n=1 Tax=Phyllosticta citriasiana TaxID=595635 RepID=UPI0030FDD44E